MYKRQSIGHALYRKGVTTDSLIAEADVKMYRQKQIHKEKCLLWYLLRFIMPRWKYGAGLFEFLSKQWSYMDKPDCDLFGIYDIIKKSRAVFLLPPATFWYSWYYFKSSCYLYFVKASFFLFALAAEILNLNEPIIPSPLNEFENDAQLKIFYLLKQVIIDRDSMFRLVCRHINHLMCDCTSVNQGCKKLRRKSY